MNLETKTISRRAAKIEIVKSFTIKFDLCANDHYFAVEH